MAIVALAGGEAPTDKHAAIWADLSSLQTFRVGGGFVRLAYGGHATATPEASEVAVVSEGLGAAAIADAYRRDGIRCVKGFLGGFSFVLHDRARETLFATSDLTSRAPLAYWSRGETLVVSSSVLRLVGHPEVGRALDEEYLAHLITGLWGAPAGMTALKDVQRLPAGMALVSRRGVVDLVRVDRLVARTRFPGGRQGCVDAFWQEVDGAVERAASDLPSCLALSGGLDSAALASSIGRRTVGSPPVAAFSIVAPDSGQDESAAIQEIERASGGQISNRRVDCLDAEELPAAPQFALQDDPLMMPIAFIPARMRLWAAARDAGCRVMLDGEGGDELFSLLIGPRDALVRHQRLHAWRFLRASRARRSTFLWSFVLPVLPSPAQRAWARRRARSGDRFPSYLTDRGRRHPLIEKAATRFYERHIEEDFAHELERWLSSPVTVGVRSTHRHLAAAHGLNLRSPLLDRRVVEFVLGIPTEWVLSTEYKGFLVEAERGRVPEGVRTRAKDDRLPSVFQRRVLASRSVREALDDETVRARLGEWIRFDRVHGLLDAIATGYDPPDATFWIQIQGIVGFARWYRRAAREHGIT